MSGPVGNELVQVIGVTGTGGPAGTTEYFTTQQIANLGGGGGGGSYTSQSIISSGTTNTSVVTAVFIGWASATTGAKTQTIPTSTGSKALITVSDLEGNAGTYPITVNPSSGSILGVNQIYTNYGSITLFDSNNGWASI